MANQEKNKKEIYVPKDSDINSAVKTSEFKDSLVNTLQESILARNEMKAVLHEILKHPDTQIEIKNIIDTIDRDAIKEFWKKFGFATWSAIIFTAGVILTAIVEKIIGH